MLSWRSMGVDATAHEASLIYLIGRVGQGIRRDLRACLAPSDLSVPEYTTLSVLDARPGLTNAQLARRALVAPPSMIAVLAKLERRGLVRRQLDASHGRILRAVLTPAGRELLREADPAVRELEDGLLNGVEAEQREVASSVILTAMRHLSRRGR